MTAYLYTWNPDRWHWADQAEAIVRINSGDRYDIYWSCGITKRIVAGDTFFLMRLGVEPKVSIGLGTVASEPYLLPHWNPVKAAAGQTALRTDLKFDSLFEIPVLSLPELNALFPDYPWTPQGGGISVPETIANALMEEIHRRTGTPYNSTEDDQVNAVYKEGRLKTLTIQTYDRSAAAREACKEHYGYKCHACGFDFFQKYGAVGRDYIEVHHLKPLADAGGEHFVDPIADLRPVCANCHRMLHTQRQPLSIEELVEKMAKRSE